MNDKSQKGYHKLLVWQKAREFVKLIYKYSDSFPRSEEFGLKGQTRRASISILLNIVEGYRRRSTKEFLRFLDISQASLTEVEACLEICLDLEYLTEKDYQLLENKRSELGFLINSLEISLKRRLKK